MKDKKQLFVKGEVVRILPEYQDPGDEEFTWVIVTDEEKGRVDISPVDIPMNIKPWTTVKVDWLERVK
jgi:hypothetical protein